MKKLIIFIPFLLSACGKIDVKEKFLEGCQAHLSDRVCECSIQQAEKLVGSSEQWRFSFGDEKALVVDEALKRSLSICLRQ